MKLITTVYLNSTQSIPLPLHDSLMAINIPACLRSSVSLDPDTTLVCWWRAGLWDPDLDLWDVLENVRCRVDATGWGDPGIGISISANEDIIQNTLVVFSTSAQINL